MALSMFSSFFQDVAELCCNAPAEVELVCAIPDVGVLKVVEVVYNEGPVPALIPLLSAGTCQSGVSEVDRDVSELLLYIK